mmetsp:Transcript_7672/g.16595  ORF Transcript_7672/g.16595 Transcript_7672/m.16595 type:complete len:336 (+) Transcript_7672:62-1069(+)
MAVGMDVDGSRHPVRPTFQLVRGLTGHTRAVASTKFNPNGSNHLATASADKTVKLWSTETGECVRTLEGHTQGISDVCWNKQGNYLCTASDDHTLKLWDVETGKALKTLHGHTNFVFCCNFDPQGHLLASGSFDETMRVWDVRSGKCLREVPAHSDPITAVDFNYDGTLLVTSSLDGLLRIWDTLSGHCLKTLFDKNSPPVSAARFCPNGRFILSGSLDSKLRLWNFEKGKAVKHYEGHTNTQYCVFSGFCTSGGGNWVVTGSEDGSIFVYELNSRKVLQHIPCKSSAGEEAGGSATGHSDAVLGLDVHPTQPLMASGSHSGDCSVLLWSHQPQQ